MAWIRFNNNNNSLQTSPKKRETVLIKPPAHIDEAHWKEWVIKSGVDPNIVRLNITSLKDYEAYDYILYGLPNSERRNSGVLRNKLLARYAHIENGGWWCSGVDVLTGEEAIWGCFKPDTPYQYKEFKEFEKTSKSKIIKYESPRQVPTEIFALKIPLQFWQAIGERYDIALPDNIVVTAEGRAIGFWAWVINNPSIPLIITEGAKKGGVILMANYVVIALPGIYGGYRQPKNQYGSKIGDPYLIEQLQVFAQPGREIIFCFDNDDKPQTVQNVRTAIAKTGALFEEAGCQVSVITWDYLPFKGVDDLIVAKTEEYFHQLYENRISLKNYNKGRKVVEIEAWRKEQKAIRNRTWKQLTSLTAKPWLVVNTPNLNEIGLQTKLERGHIYLVASAKSTAKTKTVEPLTKEFTNIYAWFNRIALGREECHKLGLTYKDDLGKFTGSLKTGFCANSAYQFNPSLLRDNGLFLADESDQVLGYLFESLCNKDGLRPAILKAFEAQLQTAIFGNGMALFLSADNTDIEYEFLKQIAPEGCEVRVILNTYKPPLGEVMFDTSKKPDDSIAELIENLKQGIPCFVIDDIKNGVKGCKSIAEYIRKNVPEIANKIVEINSDTSGTEVIQEYLRNINQQSLETLLLMCSPSVISGISIENGHFKQGYGFYNGILTTKESAQSLLRVRGLPKINVWAAEKGFTWAANRGLTPEAIREYYQHNYQQNSKYLSSFDLNYNPMKDEWESPWFDLFCKYSAYRNLAMTDLRDRLWETLEKEGFTVIEKEEKHKNLTSQLQETWGELNLDEARAIDQANVLDDERLQLLLDSPKTPTIEQQRDLTKTLLLKHYGQDFVNRVTHYDKYTETTLTGFAALYLKDDHGKWYRQLKQLYYLLEPEEIALTSDYQKEKQQLKHGSRFAGDISWNGRKRKCRTFLGLDKLIMTDWTSPKDYWAMAEKAKKYHHRVKESINLSVKKLTSSQIYTELMGQLGLDFESEWAKEKLPDGKRFKIRRITPESWELSQLFVSHHKQMKETSETQNSPNKNTEPEKSKFQITPPNTLYTKSEGGDQRQNYTPPTLNTDCSSHKEAIFSSINQEIKSDDAQTKPTQQLSESNDLDTPRAIADLADLLRNVQEPEDLAILQEISTPNRLKLACRMLNQQKIKLIKQLALINFPKKTI